MEDQYTYYTVGEEPENNFNQDMDNNEFRKPKKEKKHRKTPAWVKVVSLAVVFGLVGGGVFTATSYVGMKMVSNTNGTVSESTDKSISKTTLTTSTSSSSGSSDVSEIASEVMPSVVSITNMSVQQVQDFFGGTQEYESESCGSGIIIGKNDSELLVVTNNHVVEDCDTLTVTFTDQESVSADVKGTDSDIDIAVVAVKLSDIKDSTMDAIKIATLGDSTSIKVGEEAIAIGNALGYGQSVTEGIISAVDRELDGYEGGTLIQTDAAINPGNSGGALLNSNGEVIGINVAKLATEEVEGMGYAIPISNVTDIITELMNQETRTKVDSAKQGYLGITGGDVTDDAAQIYNMPTGVYISEVISGGGAEKAGLSRGTIITKLDGSTIDSMSTLQEKLQYYEQGEKVTLTVEVPTSNGEYKESEVEVTLGSKSTTN